MPFLVGDLGWYIGLPIWQIIIVMIIFVCFFLVVVTLFLKINLSLITSENTDFRRVFFTTLICTALIAVLLFGGTLFLIIAVFISSIIIFKRHSIKYGYSVLVTIFAVALGLVISIFSVIMIGWVIGISLI